MDLQQLAQIYNELQQQYGDPKLDSILFGGLENNPDICFVFMNPTARNIASFKEWKGLKSPWIGTKNIWTLFHELDLVSDSIFQKIQSMKGKEWTTTFAETVYDDVKKHRYFLTNLGKCTQVDARALPDSIFLQYVKLLEIELELVNPKVIILFGNQVSSIVLNEKISVSLVRRKRYVKELNGKQYPCYAVYYPIGNGYFHVDKAIEDIKWIIKEELYQKENIDQ